MLSVLLWFCVEEPDILDFEGKKLTNEVLKTRYYHKDKKNKLIHPKMPIIRTIGRRLGGEIRKFKEEIDAFDKQADPTRTVRPHTRSGHWHGYWIGKKDEKEYTVKWINATLVNARAS